jgi:hypothetical protein
MAAFAQELDSLHELESEWELESERESESEFEMELEGEGELESELSPVRRIYADGMMEHLGHMAAEAESEQEAAAHLLPLVGLAAKKILPVVAKATAPALRKAVPNVARAVTQVEPQLVQGIMRIVRGLHRSPETRSLLRAVPTIARRTVHNVAQQAARGRPITPRTALLTLAQQARRILAHPGNRAQALQRSRRMDSRFHKAAPLGAARSHIATSYRGWPGYAP